MRCQLVRWPVHLFVLSLGALRLKQWPSVSPATKLAQRLTFCAGVQFENSSEIGVFSTLTNSYCLLSYCGHGGDSEFVKEFYNELADHIPIVRCSVAGCRIVGRLTVGDLSSQVLPVVALLYPKQEIRRGFYYQAPQQIKKCSTLETHYPTKLLYKELRSGCRRLATSLLATTTLPWCILI